MRILKIALKAVLAVFFAGAGINHFLRTGFYLRMMPPYVPLHLGSVYVSGVAEVVLGVLLLIPSTSVAAAWGLIALLVAIFPANVHMALHPEIFPEFQPSALWIRLPFQPLMIAWAFWYTHHASAESSSPAQEPFSG